MTRQAIADAEAEIPESVLRQLDLAFESGPEQPTSVIAPILSMSTKTLLRLEGREQIRSRRKGTTHRLFAREDVEAYLREVYKCPGKVRSRALADY